MRNIIRYLTTSLLVVACISIVLVLFITVADTLHREVSGASLRGAVEVSEILLPAIAFGATAYTMQTNAHVASTILTDRLGGKTAALLRGVGLFAAMLVLTVIAYGAVDVALQSFLTYEVRYGLISVPIWPARVAIVLGLIALILETACQGLDELRKIFATDDDGSEEEQQVAAAEVPVSSRGA